MPKERDLHGNFRRDVEGGGAVGSAWVILPKLTSVHTSLSTLERRMFSRWLAFHSKWESKDIAEERLTVWKVREGIGVSEKHLNFNIQLCVIGCFYFSDHSPFLNKLWFQDKQQLFVPPDQKGGGKKKKGKRSPCYVMMLCHSCKSILKMWCEADNLVKTVLIFGKKKYLGG